MITDPKLKSKIGPNLDESKLNTYWAEFFRYQREAPALCTLSETALQEAIDRARHRSSPHLDAQQAISEILTNFGSKNNFHRQFNELFPFKPAQVLGMQLYSLVAADDDWWIYTETQHRGHAYPHATYFQSPGNPEYVSFVQQPEASTASND